MAAPFEALEKIFHEPNRLAIVSELSGVVGELSFVELKERCGLTDGNLSRHLTALEKAGVITIKKQFVASKPRTSIALTDDGRTSFSEYLAALEKVLQHAAARAKSEPAKRRPIGKTKPVHGTG